MTLAVNIAQGASNNVTFRNRIINGACVIDQRATAVTTANWTVDRFYYNTGTASKGTAAQSATAPAGFINSLSFTSSSAYSVGSTDYFGFQQPIEGLNIADLAWGTANASAVTLSFWVRSSLTGTFGGSLRNSSVTRSYVFSYTINSANTWEYKTITIAGDTSGTWLTTNGVGIFVQLSLAMGSTYITSPGSWQAGNYNAPTGQTSVVGTNGATFYITGVQLEAGTTASPFEYRQYGTELQLCQRYYEVAGAGAAGKANSAGNTGDHGVCLSYKVAKRATPTLSIISGTNALVIPQVNIYSISAITGINGTVNGAYFNVTTTASLGATNVPLIAYNEAWLGVSAEL